MVTQILLWLPQPMEAWVPAGLGSIPHANTVEAHQLGDGHLLTRGTPNTQPRHTTQTRAWVPKTDPTDVTVMTQTLAHTEHTAARLDTVIR